MIAITFRNARLIDPEKGTVETGELHVAGGRIVESAPAGATVVDCDGLCLAPGIVDIGVKVSRTRRTAQGKLSLGGPCGGSGWA